MPFGFPDENSKSRVPKKILRRMVWDRDKGRCKLCGVKIRAGEDWDLARIKAGAKEGKYTYANCFVAHHTCNISQGTQTLKQVKRSLGLSVDKKKKSNKKLHRRSGRREPRSILDFRI